ncbi:MAG: hypothetical protein ACLQOZ_06460 [Acidimicrobiales bacterium]|jgi:hypothetical protein
MSDDPEDLERRLRSLSAGADNVPFPSGPTLRATARRRRERRGAVVVVAVVVVAAAIGTSVLWRPTASHTTPASRKPVPTTTTAPFVTTTTPPTASTVAPEGTQDIRYDPFTATGVDPSLQVTSQASGTCIRYGGGADGQYYYRCFAPGIYDPCFAGPQGTAAPLVCPSSPVSADVVEVTVTSITSTEPPTASVHPWAMQLSTGQVCLFVSAAWGGLGPYGCQPSSTAPSFADCHQPVSAQPYWNADCQDQQTDSSPFTSMEVAKVWF